MKTHSATFRNNIGGDNNNITGLGIRGSLVMPLDVDQHFLGSEASQFRRKINPSDSSSFHYCKVTQLIRRLIGRSHLKYIDLGFAYTVYSK